MYKHGVYKLIGVIFYCIQHIFAATVIDLDTTDVFTKKGHTNGHQLRMVTYDVAKQQFLKVQYFYSGKETSVISPDITKQGFSLEYSQSTNGGSDNFPLTIKIKDCKIDKDIWLLLPSYAEVMFSPECSATTTHCNTSFSQDTVKKDRKLVRHTSTACKDSKTLFALLSCSPIKSTSSIFKLTLHDNLSNLNITSEILPTSADSPLDNAEKGRLGEVATDSTFFVYGFTKLASKLNGKRENGRDGVFIDSEKKPTILFVTESKFWDDPVSRDELKKIVGLDTLQQKLENEYANNPVKPKLTAASQGRYLHTAGQSFLTDGHMSTPYLSSALWKISEPSFEGLREKLSKLKKDSFEDKNTKLAKALNLDEESLRKFVKGKTKKSDSAMQRFLIYINKAENLQQRDALFPEEAIPETPQTAVTLSSRFAGHYSPELEKLLKGRDASDAMVEAFKAIYASKESFDGFLKLFAQVQTAPEADVNA